VNARANVSVEGGRQRPRVMQRRFEEMSSLDTRRRRREVQDVEFGLGGQVMNTLVKVGRLQ